MKRNGRVALVVDTSGSMGFVDYFSLGMKLQSIQAIHLDNFCNTKELEALAEKYEEVVFVTDGVIEPSWTIILNTYSNIKVVRVGNYFFKATS